MAWECKRRGSGAGEKGADEGGDVGDFDDLDASGLFVETAVF